MKTYIIIVGLKPTNKFKRSLLKMENEIKIFMNEIVESLPIGAEIYRVEDYEEGVKVAYYDHFKDYGNYKFVRSIKTTFKAVQLKGLVGRFNNPKH